MYNILLLRKMLESSQKIKDYLQLSGWNVVEGELNHIAEYEEMIDRVDLILMECDVVEPYFVVCEQIRERTQNPIIVLSNSNDEWGKIKMFQSGADDYMVIPYAQTELIARMQTRVERFRSLTRPFGIIQARGLQINAFSREVTLNGTEVSLRLKEFDVLLFLAQHMNQVLKKEEIYEAVWKDGLGDGFYNSVAVHIKRIREKIEEDIENPQYIETVWGLGYRFRK